MKNKIKKRTEKRLLLVGILGIVLISFIFLVNALTDDETQTLQDELNNLTRELSDNNYDWLIDYNITHPQIEVYENNRNEMLAKFENIFSDGYNKIYLTNLSGHGECYDNETEILTENGWKFFKDLNGKEKVATLNQTTGATEWQLPTEKQEFDNHNGELYSIKLEDGSEMRVSEKHKVYIKNELDYSSLRNLNNLPVENISTLVCFLNDSSDHSPQLREIANAKYCKSFSCGEVCLASLANLLKSSNGIGSICSFIISKTSENSSKDNLLLFTISPKFLPISVNKYSGEMNSIFPNDLFNRKTSKTVPLDSNAEITLLASTTININYSLVDCKNLFDKALSTLSDNSLTSSSDNCDLETIERSLALSCNSLLNKNLINNEKSPDFSISSFQSSGILTNISVMQESKDKDYKKLSVEGFALRGVKEIYNELKDNGGSRNYSSDSIFSDICLVDIAKPISNNNFSYAHNLIFLDKQSAIKSSSFVCLPNNCLALGINELYSSNGTNVILLNSSVENLLNLSSESFDFSNISSLCLLNFSLSFNGANIFNLRLNNSLRIFPLEINVLNKTLESIPTSIYINPFFLRVLCIDNLTLSDNSSASFSVNSLFEIISSAIANSKLFINSCTTLASANSNSLLNSGAMSTLKQISAMPEEKRANYINVANKLTNDRISNDLSKFKLEKISDIYSDILNGKIKADNLMFLDENGREVRVNSIEKVPYSGKIYDVDVGNDVVLVRRNKIVCDKVEKSRGGDEERANNELINERRINSNYEINERGKENKGSEKVTRMVTDFPQKINLSSDSKYINFSVSNGAEDAVVTRTVRELPDEQYLLSPEGSLGSNPSHGDSSAFSNGENDNRINENENDYEEKNNLIINNDDNYENNELINNKIKKGSNEIANPVNSMISSSRYFLKGTVIFKSFDNLIHERPDGEMVDAVASRAISSFQGNVGSSPTQGAPYSDYEKDINENKNLNDNDVKNNELINDNDKLNGDDEKASSDNCRVVEGTPFWSGNSNSETHSQDVFDLKIIGGSVEFDYIVDPPYQTLIVDAVTTLCGEVTNYSKIIVNGTLNICPYTGAGTGYVNISLGAFGNFTVYGTGKVLGNGSGVGGGAGAGGTNFQRAYQGTDGNTLTAGIQSPSANGGGGGGANKSNSADAASGGGGGFGGAGGIGGNGTASGIDAPGRGGGTYGSSTATIVQLGSGGGGGAGDNGKVGAGGAGGGGLKINVSSGWINVQGLVNLSAIAGGPDPGASTSDAGGGGGGSGGHLVLIAQNMSINNTNIWVSGGAGGNANAAGTDTCGGGGGGGGRIVFLYGTLTNTTQGYNYGAGSAGTSGGCDAAPAGGTAGTVSHTSMTFPAQDTTFPQINMTYPQNISYNVNVTQLNYTASDDIALHACWYSTNGGLTNSSTNGCGANFTGITSTEGSNTWIVWAEDSSANQNSSTITFFKDAISPIVTIVFPANATYGAVNLPLNFTVTLNEQGSALYSLDGGINNVTMFSGSSVIGTTLNATNGSIATGSYRFRIYANDTAGNKNYTAFMDFSIDTVAPTFSSYYDNNETLVDSGTALFNVTVANTNGTVFLEINGANYSAHNLTVSVYNVSVSLTNGTYNYYWGSWGNGTNKNYNISAIRSYTIGSTNLTSCGKLGVANTVYTQRANIVPTNDAAPCINITASNVTFNGNSFWIYNNSFNNRGIYTLNQLNVTVRNVNVSVNGTNSNGQGIEFNGVNSSRIDNSTLNSNDYGIFHKGSFNIITNTTTNSNSMGGIYLYSSNNNNISDCISNFNRGDGRGIEINVPSDNNIITNCTLNSNRLYGVSISSSGGYSNAVIGSTMINNSRGIWADYTTGCIIENNTIYDSISYGIYLTGDYCRVSGNIINNSRRDAIVIQWFNENGNNNITNTSITNTNASFYDINILAANTVTSFVDMPSIANYTIAGAGSKIIVTNTRYGEIRFLTAVNGSGSNFSADIQILNNSAIVRSNINNGLNKSANVTLYGLSQSFTSPVILRDGATCPAGVCWNFTSLNAGNVLFNVSYWTNYSIGEAPDNTPPIVTINQPQNTTYNSFPIPFNVTLNENGNACNYTLDNGINNYTMQNNGNRDFNATNSSIADGSYLTKYYCWDTVGNVNNTASKAFSVDVTAPTITIVSPLNNSNYNSATVGFNVTLSETGTWCGYSVNGAANITMTSFNTTYFNFTNTTMTNKAHTAVFSCNDTANNWAFSALSNFLVDALVPGVSFIAPTPNNASSQTATAIYVNVSSNDTNEHYVFNDFDNSLVGWWRLDNDASAGENATHVKDWSGQCYDNETEILTLEEVDCNSAEAEFVEFNGEIEKIDEIGAQSNETALLINDEKNAAINGNNNLIINNEKINDEENAEIDDNELNNKQIQDGVGDKVAVSDNAIGSDNNDNEKINNKINENENDYDSSYEKLNGNEISNNELINENLEEAYSKSKNFFSSSVVKTLIEDCSLKCASLDQTGILNSSASARNGTSVLCEINLSAFSSKNCKGALNSISSDSKETSSRNFSLLISDLEQIMSAYLNNSSIRFGGENNSRTYSLSNRFVSELALNNENTTLVSTTNFIHSSSCFSDITFLNSLPSLRQSASVNLELSKSFSNFSNISNCLIFFRNASLANADQFSQENLSILNFKSSGTDSVIDTIFNSDIYYVLDTLNNIIYIYKPFGIESNENLASDKTLIINNKKIIDNKNKINNGENAAINENELTNNKIAAINEELINKNKINGNYDTNENGKTEKIDETYPIAKAPDSVSSHVFPALSSEKLLMKSNTNCLSLDNSGGCTLMTNITGSLEGVNNAVLRKSLSLDNMPRCSLQDNLYKCEFVTPLSTYIISMPLSERNFTSLASISSSENNLSFNINESFSGNSFSSVMQGCLDVFFSQGRVSFKNFTNRSSTFKHFKDGMYHYSGTFESRFSMTNLSVCNNIFIDFYSHNSHNDDGVYKDFDIKCYKQKWKYFNELNGNEKVATLNQTTGETEWEVPMARQVFDNHGEMYKIETDRGELVVSEKHKVYVSSDISNLSSYKVINLPLKSSGFNSLSNIENAEVNDSTGLDCGIFNQTTENIFSLGYKNLSLKSQSLVTNTLCSDLENSANLPFANPLGFEIMSTPCFFRNVSNLLFTFSSLRNLTEWDAELDIISSSHKTCRILQCCFNMLFSDSRIIFEDFINAHPSFEHFENLPNHDSCAFESRFSMTNLSVCNNIGVNFNSHNSYNEDGVYKDFDIKCYKQKWKYFKELNGNEKVATLNQTIGKTEWQLPMEKQVFDNHNNYLYSIKLEDGSEMRVSEKHKVYVGEEVRNYNNLNSFIRSSVENISISDCSLNASSSDQIGILFNDNDNAKYGSSFVPSECGDILLASERNSLYLPSSIISTSLLSSKKISSNSDSVILAKCIISDLLLDNSSSVYSGEIKLQPLSRSLLNTSLLADDKLKNEKSIDASTISSEGIIFYNPCLFATLRFNSSASLDANSSVILLFFNISSNLSNFLALSNLSDNSSLTISDQITQTNLDNLLLNSSSIANVTDAIYSSPLVFNSSTFSSSFSFLIIALRDTSATFISGNSFLNLANNSSGICTVILSDFTILTPCSIYINTSNYANIYKPFGQRDLNFSGFALRLVTETYEEIKQGKELYFLDENNKPIKIKNITKQNYSGKIYDVDVPSDIILVRRGENATAFWSGNSNNGTVVGGATATKAGKFGGAEMFDGVDDYVNISDTGTLDSVVYTITAWIYPIAFGGTPPGQGKAIYSNYIVTDTNPWNGVGFDIGGAGSSVANQIVLFNNDNTASYTTVNSGTQTVSLNTWSFVAANRNSSGGVEIYINGNLANSSQTSDAPSFSNARPFIGKTPPSGQYFNGTIDEVLIFNRSLSASEIASLYNASATKYQNNFTSLADGTHTFTAYAVDAGGNKNQTEKRQVTVDTTAPNITSQTPANATITSNQTVNFTANLTDIGAGLANATLYIYNQTGLYNMTIVQIIGAPLTASVGVVVYLIEGIYTWFWQVFDIVNNMISSTNATTGVGSNYTITVDITAPAVNITFPINGTAYNSNVTELNYTTSDTRLQSCWWSNSSGMWNSSRVTPGVNFTGMNATEGTNTWSVYCNDTANNVNSSSVVFVKDTVAPIVYLSSPLNGTNSSYKNITFNAPFNDNVNLNNVTFYLWNSSFSLINQTTIVKTGATNSSSLIVVIRNGGTYYWNYEARDSVNYVAVNNTNYTFISLRFVNFSSFPLGTNFSDVDDLMNVTNLTLANTQGKINFPVNYSVNALGQDYDKNVNISERFVSVNASALDAGFNFSANITIYNSSCFSGGIVYFGNNQSYNSAEEIILEGNICNAGSEPSCAGFQCVNEELTFTASHFTGYASTASANLTIWDETDAGMPNAGLTKYANDMVKFFANYTNKSVGVITGANCYLNFSDMNLTMDYNSTSLFYEQNRTFSSSGSFVYNVSCDKAGFDSLTANDSVLITGGTPITQCQALSSADTVYNLLNNVSSSATCFNVMANNITLDCQGYLINYSTAGTVGFGVNVSGYNFTTIQNCNITDISTGSSKYAIYFNKANNGTIFNNTIRTYGNYDYGIYVLTGLQNNLTSNTVTTSGSYGYGIPLSTNSNNNQLTNNRMTTSGYGIYLVTNANNNQLLNNTITTSGAGFYGLFISSSSNNNLSNNNVTALQGNSYHIYGTTSSHYNNTITNDNLAENKPLNYTYNADNLVFNNVDFTQYGQVIFAYSRNITIQNSNFSLNGLSLMYTNGSTIANNNITSKGDGLRAESSSSFNNFTNNNIRTYNSSGLGIYLYSSSNNNQLSNNTVTTSGAEGYGIYLYSSSNNNQLTSNTIRTSGQTGYSIYIFTTSNNNQLLNNTITTSGPSGNGVFIRLNSNNNQILNNTIATLGNGGVGIRFLTANNNQLSSNTITTSNTNAHGIYLDAGTTNNTFSGMRIITNNTASPLYIVDTNQNFTIINSILNESATGKNDTLIAAAVKGGTWNFTNVTRADGTKINITWMAGANGTLNMHWYLDANVTDTNSVALQNANVSAWDVNNLAKFSLLTPASGLIGARVLLEYTRNSTSGTNYTYYVPHTVNTTLAGYTTNSTSVNISATLNTLLGVKLNSSLTVSSCSVLDAVDRSYTQTANIIPSNAATPCINITASNVTFNGNGFWLYNNSFNNRGIYAGGQINVTIRNVNVSVNGTNSSGNGVEFVSTSNSLIKDSILNSNYYGVYFQTNSDNNQLNNVTANSNSQNGIYFDSSSSNQLNNITANSNLGYGVFLSSSSSNQLNNISANNNTVYGIYLSSSSNNNLSSITANSNSQDGIYLYSSANNNQLNSLTTNNNANYGIYLYSSANNNLSSITANSNTWYGIWLDTSSNNNQLTNVTVNSNTLTGIRLTASSNNIFIGGTINASKQDAITLITLPNSGNKFSNISTTNTNASFYDVNFATGSINGTQFIDMPSIAKYTFTGDGGTIVVKKTGLGEVWFRQAVNGSGTNFSADVKILNNSAIVRSNINGGLNKSANVTLYGLSQSFSAPAILRDGVACPTGVCWNFTSLNAGTVIFNVSAWTNYSVGEAPDNTPPNINFTAPTPANGTTTANTSIIINVSISEANGIGEVKWNWNGTNYTFYDNSLVLMMNFNNNSAIGENQTHVVDVSNYSNNGTLYNGTLFNASGKYGGAMQFDGIDDYIRILHNTSLSISNISVEFWFKSNQSWTSSAWDGSAIFLSKSTSGTGSSDWAIRGASQNNGVNEGRVRVTSGAGGDYQVSSQTGLNDNKWHHFVWTRVSAGDNYLYVDGLQQGTVTDGGGNINNTRALDIGNDIIDGGASPPAYNGSIDELYIWNRALSAAEVTEHYFSNLQKFNQTQWYLYVNQSKNATAGLGVGIYSYFASAKDNIGNENLTETRFVTIISGNVAPNNPSPTINSTTGTNKTLENLNCFATITDNDNNTMNVSVEWYKNKALSLHVDYNNSYANGTFFNAVLDDGNTTKEENWSCGMRLFDGTAYSAWVNSSNLTILNTPPVVTLVSPASGNITTNRTPTFTWSANDDDGEILILTYELNLSCVGGCAAQDSRYIRSITFITYTVVGELQFLSDNGYYYNWSVRANDSTEFGAWTGARNISIQSLVDLTLRNATVDFGSIAAGASNDTTDNSPLPLLLENTGNVFVNVTINASDLWSTQTNPSQYYQFKIANFTLENYSFSWPLSITSFTNMPTTATPLLAIALFNYSDATDLAEIDINITVPPAEGAGARSSLVIFTGSLSE